MVKTLDFKVHEDWKTVYKAQWWESKVDAVQVHYTQAVLSPADSGRGDEWVVIVEEEDGYETAQTLERNDAETPPG